MNDPLDVATDVAREAGALLREMYAETALDVQIKEGDERNLVTAADLAADRLIRERLAAAFPDHALFTEEGYTPGAMIDRTVPTWIVDPLDGTSNYAHGFPSFAVSIALYDGAGAQVGVIYDPLRDWLFAARAGGGATLNGKPLHVSDHAELRRCIVSCDWARLPERRARVVAILTELAATAHTLRSIGSAALAFCFVAAGWLDVYYNLSLGAWDMAAGALIVREAGGQITDEHGAPWSLAAVGALATNGRVHAAAAEIINRHWPPATL